MWHLSLIIKSISRLNSFSIGKFFHPSKYLIGTYLVGPNLGAGGHCTHHVRAPQIRFAQIRAYVKFFS